MGSRRRNSTRVGPNLLSVHCVGVPVRSEDDGAVQNLEDTSVRIRPHSCPAPFPKKIDDFSGLPAAVGQVTCDQDVVNVLPIEVFQHGLKRREISVNARDDRDPHAQVLGSASE